ncbi:DUF4304 domain-containing protein [Collimonas sp. OK242]|uniref:DUF4304 domain-containing protein n=1 Tax=Collimonas sp. OK242 TaxID=1798195 RepID=UPI00115FFF21|nr:DUF4304 domain-containing protein [Collimonas sp. OK242]
MSAKLMAIQIGDDVHEIFKKIAPTLRSLGFRGTGQNFRKSDNDFAFVINLQVSRSGENFFVNLGAQPTFIPAEGNAELGKLKEYECILRKRVGKDWSFHMSEEAIASLIAEISSAQASFFGDVQTMRQALAVEPPEELLRRFSSGTTQARATLHLARGAVKLGYLNVAKQLVEYGLLIAGDAATLLRADLEAVRNAS